MLDFNKELSRLYAQVKQEYEATPLIRVDYPTYVTKGNWDNVVSESIVPPMTGYLYFIYNSERKLLYLGKAQRVGFALKSHLVKRTSATTCSILDDVKKLIVEGEDKYLYIKAIEVQPREYSAVFKPLLAREYKPELVKRIS